MLRTSVLQSFEIFVVDEEEKQHGTVSIWFLHEAETSTGSSFAPARSDFADPVSCIAFCFVCQN